MDLDAPHGKIEEAPTPTPDPAAQPPSEPRPTFLDRLPVWIVPALLVGIPLAIALGAAVAPEAVYDGFVWKYYWGPIHADASNVGAECLRADGAIVRGACGPAGGVTAESGYNVVNTATWAALLGLCLVGVAQLLARRKTVMGGTLIVGAVGWVVAGSVFHVLEDVGLFAPPTQYFFITPPIYLLFAAMGVVTFVLGHYLKGVAERANLELALQKLLFVVALPIVGYLLLWARTNETLSGQVTAYLNPIVVTVFGLAAYLGACVRFRRLGRIDPSELVGWMSLGWILTSLAYVALYLQSPWPDPATGRVDGGDGLLTALWAPVLALLGVLAVRLVAKAIKNPKAKAYLDPINGLLIYSQLLDGFATSIGIDTGAYTEKHVLSDAVIQRTHDLGVAIGFGPMADYPSFFGFLPIKLALSLLVVYAIDVSNPKEAQRNPTLIGLVKFAIIMVGLGPGIRDFVRMALGV
jgi:uncharacterized membrane protein